MNALSCHVPAESKEPLGQLLPAGGVLVLDEVVALGVWAVMCAKAANDERLKEAA